MQLARSVGHRYKVSPMKPVEHLTDDEFSQRVQQAVQALPDAPAAWQQTAMALWPAKGTLARLAETAQALGRLVQATLSFDSWASPGLAHGMRGSHGPVRHLLYSAEGRDIDLRIAATAEHYTVNGQVLGPDEAGQVELTADGTSHVTALDELGEFHLDDLPPGRYTLILHTGSASIQVPPIEIGDLGR